MKANYTIYEEDSSRVTLLDIGPHSQHLTITNDAERVVKEMLPYLNGRQLVYIDSLGELTELRIRNGEFAGFNPVLEEEEL